MASTSCNLGVGLKKPSNILLGAVIKPQIQQASAGVQGLISGELEGRKEIQQEKDKYNSLQADTEPRNAECSLDELLSCDHVGRLRQVVSGRSKAGGRLTAACVTQYSSDSQAVLRGVEERLVELAAKCDASRGGITRSQEQSDRLLQALDIAELDQQVVVSRLDLVEKVHAEISERLGQFEDYLAQSGYTLPPAAGGERDRDGQWLRPTSTSTHITAPTTADEWRRNQTYEQLSTVDDTCSLLVGDLVQLIESMHPPHRSSDTAAAAARCAATLADTDSINDVDKVTDILNHHEEALRQLSTDLDEVKLDFLEGKRYAGRRHMSMQHSSSRREAEEEEEYFDASDILSPL